jgi:ABC-type enterochelin transport system permease subunit
MKASTKAALISALVFPGLGHLVLRKGARGLLFIVPAALAVTYLLRSVLQLLDRLMDDINRGALALDPVAILERVHASGIDNAATNLASLVCIVCWAGSIIDALWLGRRKAG